MDFASVFELSSWDYVLLVLLAVLFYRWLRRPVEDPSLRPPSAPKVEPLPMQDLTLAELKKYNGVDDEHILFAVNGTIFDVSRGRNFYGPGSAYGSLAGRDATRALATMDTKAVREDWDDHQDLSASEKETADDWENSFKLKYSKVGQLVQSSEVKTDYAGKLSGISL